MSDQDRIAGYADAVLAVAEAEGTTQRVSDELYTLAQAVEGNDELRATLADATTPAGQRQQVVEDLLANKATGATSAVVSMIVGAGRAADLLPIARAVAEKAAGGVGKKVAEVRSAVPLDADQQARLAQALKQSTGSDVDLKVVIDPSVMGGLVTQIGDTVIDGSVRNRLTKMRDQIA